MDAFATADELVLVQLIGSSVEQTRIPGQGHQKEPRPSSRSTVMESSENRTDCAKTSCSVTKVLMPSLQNFRQMFFYYTCDLAQFMVAETA